MFFISTIHIIYFYFAPAYYYLVAFFLPVNLMTFFDHRTKSSRANTKNSCQKCSTRTNVTRYTYPSASQKTLVLVCWSEQYNSIHVHKLRVFCCPRCENLNEAIFYLLIYRQCLKTKLCWWKDQTMYSVLFHAIHCKLAAYCKFYLLLCIGWNKI